MLWVLLEAEPLDFFQQSRWDVFFFCWPNRKTQLSASLLSLNEDKSLKCNKGRSENLSFLRKHFEPNAGCCQFSDGVKTYHLANLNLLTLKKILQCFYHPLLLTIHTNSTVFCFIFCYLSTVAVGNKDAETNLADKR